MDQEGQLSFERDIRPRFREKDRERMLWAFDLWHYPSVKENAPQILERLEARDMPCDGEWAQDQIEAFARWMQQGMPQ